MVIDTLLANNSSILGITDIDPQKAGSQIRGIPIIGNDNILQNYDVHSVRLVNGIGSVKSIQDRKCTYERFKKLDFDFNSIIHPSAIIAGDVKLDEGVQIMAGSIIQAGAFVGENTIVNTGTIIDHNCLVGRHVHLSPGVTLSGGVKIGDCSHVGTAATLIQGVEIGANSIVAAGAVVLKDVPPGVTVMGIPARIYKK